MPANLHDEGHPDGIAKEKGKRVTPLRAGQKPEWDVDDAITALEGGSLDDWNVTSDCMKAWDAAWSREWSSVDR